MNSTHNTDSILTSVIQPLPTVKRSKFMGHVRFTGKPSRVSGSMSGLKAELFHSQKFHSEGIALLISPQLLRSRDLGQIDIARLNKKESWILEIAEVKSSAMGFEAFQRGQRKRIILSGNFFSGIFGCPVKFIRLLG